jgi:hypothetical protein
MKRLVMGQILKAIAEFLSGRRGAVAGVSRGGRQPSNAILRRLAERTLL